MADKKTGLPPGIYETRVDTGEDDKPNVPEPESPPTSSESEVPREEWEPKFKKYIEGKELEDEVVEKIEDET